MAGALAKLSRRIVALAAFLVPATDRERLKQEWEAELAHRFRHERTTLAAWLLLRRSLDAIPHALFILKEQWSLEMISKICATRCVASSIGRYSSPRQL